MIKKYLLFLLIASIVNAGCLKDNSIYNYSDREAITVTGIEESYTVVSAKDRLTLSPEAKSTDPNADFEYFWGIYETNVQGSIPKLDTLSKTKDLDYLIDKPAKDWVLVFGVKNRNSGFTHFVNSKIKVVTEFTRGWYVAKDDGSMADLDLFTTPESYLPGSLSENVYSIINGQKLKGKARFLSFLSSYRSTANGPLGNTRTLILSSAEDIALTNINTLENIRTIDNISYSPPEVRDPAEIFNGSSAYYFINNGQLHSIYNRSANDGRFGARVMINANNDPYHLSKYFLTYRIADPLLFDEMSSSFVTMSMGYGSLMTEIKDVDGSEMSAKDNNKKLLYLGAKNADAPEIIGTAIFQDKTDPSIKILSDISIARLSNKTMIINDTLDASSDKLYDATQYAVLSGDEDILYFAIDNEIWSRNLSNGFEKLEYTIPSGEELTFLRHKKYTGEPAYAFNFIMIGTKVGDKYKVRMFEKSSGSITGEPKFTLEGNGIVRDVIYISPSVSEDTYTVTY